MRKEYLEAGRIVGTHGVRGELRMESWCDDPAFLRGVKTLYWDPNGAQKVTVQHSRSDSPAMESTRMPRGTKVMRATSLVMNMLLTKQRKTRVKTMPRPLRTWPSSRPHTQGKTPWARSPSITAIRQNRRMRVSKSI